MLLNFFPINMSFDSYDIYTEPYSQERLDELRKSYNKTHSFFRFEDKIYISNKDGADDFIIGERSIIELHNNPGITSSLIKHIFFRTFREAFPSHTPISFYPFRFFSKQERDDEIYGFLPADLKNIVSYKKQIEIQLRQLSIKQSLTYGFTITVKRNWLFKKNCKQLQHEGLEMKGLEVLKIEHFATLVGVLEADGEFIGKILEIKEDSALIQTSEGVKEHSLNTLTLRKTNYNMNVYLSFRLGEEKCKKIFDTINSRKSEIYNAEKQYKEIIQIAEKLFCEKHQEQLTPRLYNNKDGFCFTVNNKMYEANNTIDLKTPTFFFDYALTKSVVNYPDRGLNDFGPYDSENFEPKKINILCIGHKENRGYVTSFLAVLIGGIPQSTFFKKGLKQKYHLHDIQTDTVDISSYKIEEYFRVLRDLGEKKPDLVIIEIPSYFKQYSIGDNPYYKIKAKLLNLEIPVQFITSNNIKYINEYILNPLALQLYAKLGGTPWVLPSNRSVDRELIIGIGHSWIREGNFKGAEFDRVVGITTFLSSDGQYLLGEKVKDVPFSDYFDELQKSLKTSFNILEKEQGWVEGNTIRLIFHIFKPIKNVEFDVIVGLIKEFPKYKIQFAFVTISKIHPFKMFDLNQRGVVKGGIVKGKCIPNRGTNIFLDNTTALIQMTGANELKTAKHGMSAPIQVKIRTPQGNYENVEIEPLLFTDLDYIVQQVYSFTYLSWRSFLPAESPATMLYSDLISNLLSRLRTVQGWDPECLNFKLKRKKWFL